MDQRRELLRTDAAFADPRLVSPLAVLGRDGDVYAAVRDA